MIKENFWFGYNKIKKSYIWFVYIIFASYILYLGITSSTISTKLFFLTVGFLILSISLYYEYLKWIYQKMIFSLTMETNIPLAKKYQEKLIKQDFLHGFKQSIILFDSLLLLDEGKYEECLIHMKKNENFFRSTLDYLLIFYHNKLICYYFLNEHEKGLKQINKLLEIKSLNQKKYSPLFPWDEIEALRFFFEGRIKKSIQTFLRIESKYLNAREKTYLYYMLAQGYKKINDINKYGEYLNLARHQGNSLMIARKQGLQNETFE